MNKVKNTERRDFLKLSGMTATLLASEATLFANSGVISIKNAKDSSPNRSYTEEMYRNEFAFTYGKKEEQGYALHSNCAWEVWSHNGVVTRENQSACYPSVDPKVPDSNPGGSTQDAQYSQLMYQKDRILYPMIRVGKRGEGKFRRATWDEAAEHICGEIFRALSDPERGAEKLLVDVGDGLLSESRRASVLRFSAQLGATRVYPANYKESTFSGAHIAYGNANVGCTWDFMYEVNTIVLWGANPSVSHMSDAHFVWEGKYNGAKVITITPEFNATAKSSDLWIPIKAGSDNILAMSIIQVILAEKLYKPEFMKHFTDLVFLVDVETQKLLRRSEMEIAPSEELEESYDEEFYAWNTKINQAVLMPGSRGSDKKSLDLDDLGIDPALEGSFEIIDRYGERRRVVTVFEKLKSSAEEFTPEMTQGLTGVHPDTLRVLAKEMALPKVVEVTVGANLNKYFNGVQTIWNIASICGLTAHMGSYGGLNTEKEFSPSNLEILSGFNGKYSSRLSSGFVSEFIFGDGLKSFKEYFNEEDVQRAQKMSKYEYMEIVKELLESDNSKPWYLPDTALLVSDSTFSRGSEYRKAFLQKMKFFAYVDFRMNETAQYADVLLPAKSDYEVYDLNRSASSRFISLAQPVADIKSVGEALDEWSIFTLLAQKLEEIANRDENIRNAKVQDSTQYAKPGYHDLSIFHEEYTNRDDESVSEGKPYLGSDKMAVEAILESCEEYSPWTIEKIANEGGSVALDLARTYNSMENNLDKLEPLKTLSGRQTFYVDHEYFIKLGTASNSALEGINPIFRNKEQRKIFKLITTSSRYASSVNYKTSRTLLRLQRGVPYVSVNRVVAETKGIKDGETIRVFNSLGEFLAMAKLSSSTPPDTLVMEDGYEAYMYKLKKGHGEVLPTALNLLEMADGWGHLKFSSSWDGNKYAYDAAVDFEKVSMKGID